MPDRTTTDRTAPADPAAAPGRSGRVRPATAGGAAAPSADPARLGRPGRGRRPLRAPRPSRRGPRAWLAFGLPPVLLFAAMIGVWYLVSYRVLDPDRRFLLPPPHRVIEVAFLDRGNAEVLLRALALTTGVAMTGLAVAIVLGIWPSAC